MKFPPFVIAALPSHLTPLTPFPVFDAQHLIPLLLRLHPLSVPFPNEIHKVCMFRSVEIRGVLGMGDVGLRMGVGRRKKVKGVNRD